MTYKQTTLWRAAFEESRSDATSDDQARLAGCYEAMRARAGTLVGRISADLPHMTVHDVTHLDALWEMASIACGTQVDLNPAEAFVFGGSVLLHDAAMTLAAFPGGLPELKQTTEWQDLFARYSAGDSGTGTSVIEIERRATEDALRLLHAKHAEHLPKISWDGPGGDPMYIIEDAQVRNFYGPKIGKIAYSHWWSIAKVEEELAGTLGGLPGVTNCTVDLLKVACVLRVADAMHLDQRRAPAFEFALLQPTGISADHWKFQQRMAKPFVQGDALVYTAQPPFEIELAEAWWTAFDALQMVDRELRNVDRVLRDRQKSTLVVRRVEGVQAPEDLARSVETTGWLPVDSTVRVTDVPKIVGTLGGSKLYGSSVAAPIRELIQNALDAINARRRLQSRPSTWGMVLIRLEKKEDGFWLSVEDNGVGMSTSVLTGPLIDFGNSFWRSSLAIQEFPGLSAAGMKARGKYGIGFFSAFMLGDYVRVVSRRFDRDVRSAKIMEFSNGLASRPNMRDADPKELPVDGGTRIEIRLNVNPSDEGGLLYKRDYGKVGVVPLANLVAAVAPAVDVDIQVIQDSIANDVIKAGDWLKLSAKELIARISQGRSSNAGRAALPLSELRDSDGKIYGRARIDAEFWSAVGVIVVDGLAAGSINAISGILTGVETTASRNTAVATVPASVLSSWASEQALMLESADISDGEKSRAATIVLSCGGDIGNLPIVWWGRKWMSSSDFAAEVVERDEIIVVDGDISHDEDDDVTKRDFEAAFEADAEIAQTVQLRYGQAEWARAVGGVKSATTTEILEKILYANWGDFESYAERIVVGDVYGTDIFRNARIYRKLAEAEA